MQGRLRPWSLLRSVRPEIGWAFCCVYCDGCIWSPYVAFMDVFGTWKFFVIQSLPNARFWMKLWVNFGVTRGWIPKNMLSSTSWPSSSEFWPLLGRDGSCLEGRPFLPLESLPSPGVWALGEGAGASRPLWEKGWGLLEEHLGFEPVVSLKKKFTHFGLVCGSN